MLLGTLRGPQQTVDGTPQPSIISAAPLTPAPTTGHQRAGSSRADADAAPRMIRSQGRPPHRHKRRRAAEHHPNHSPSGGPNVRPDSRQAQITRTPEMKQDPAMDFK